MPTSEHTEPTNAIDARPRPSKPAREPRRAAEGSAAHVTARREAPPAVPPGVARRPSPAVPPGVARRPSPAVPPRVARSPSPAVPAPHRPPHAARPTSPAVARRRLFTTLAGIAAIAAAAPAAAQDWRDGATCYEIFVRSFFDSDGDGIGDLEGVIRKLDYLNDGDPDTQDDLGVSCIWLMPIMESPSYHGYDVTDFYRVNPDYGTNTDFERLVAAAHRRGIRVIVDMLVNHVSNRYPHFVDALENPDSPWRDWFTWSERPGPPDEWGGNNWRRSPVRDEYYYGLFSGVMPDLNWENPDVRDEMERVAAFWLRDMGADGLRLDAVRHLMEADDGKAANVPRTHEMLHEYEDRIRAIAPESFTIGEVFDSTDVMRAYYPDQLDAYFAFQVANAILDAVRTASGTRLLAQVERMLDVAPANRWGTFLRNHDQVRTRTWFEGDMTRSTLAAGLLLTLPGIPFVYYGEEIGMIGDKPDPRIRTPMQWSPQRAGGFTTGRPWEPLQPDSLTHNVELLAANPASILNAYRRLIHLRAANGALGSGDIVPLQSDTDGAVAWLRRNGDSVALVVANLGDRPLTGTRFSSDRPVLPSGEYNLSTLYGDVTASTLTVDGAGGIRSYLPADRLPPLSLHVFEIPAGARRPGN